MIMVRLSMTAKRWYCAVRFNRFVQDVSGQGIVEYSLILLLVVIVCMGVLTLIGLDTGNHLHHVAAKVANT